MGRIPKLTRPTIHLNGTAPDDLHRGYQAAVATLRPALAKLEETAPNARDYYPQGPDAFEAARREHEHRVARLTMVLCELVDLSGHALRRGNPEDDGE